MLRYERGALADLEDVFGYIAPDDRGAAARLVARIEDAVGRLVANPRMGEKTRDPRFRRLVVGKHVIVYEIGTDEVVIQYVRHGARSRPWEGK